MKITVADYIVKKLISLQIKNVFGLPGDYNFNILDAIIKKEGINWINCTNELNASYASDGYARINGYGAIVTTYGVGEFSAMNGIAGCYSENLPVIHITGVPKSSFIENKVLVHHNFISGDYYTFERAQKNVVETTAYLNEKNAKSEIDRIFDVMVNKKLPVYVAIPVDVCCQYIEDDDYKINIQKSDENNLNLAFNKIKELIESSKNPILFVDYLTKRFKLQNEVLEFIKNTNIKFSSFIMGKGAISEEQKGFLGTYTGNYSPKLLLDEIKNSDLTISIGYLNGDLNTGGFSTFEEKNLDILIDKTKTTIKGEVFENVLVQDIVRLIAKNIKAKFSPRTIKETKLKTTPKEKIKIEDIIPKIESVFDKNDVFIMEMGLLSLSGGLIKLKDGMEYLSQTLWGSIGWATPAAFGAMMANKEKNNDSKIVLFVGDGSIQLTCQEIANYFEYDLKPVVFILNNKGYTIERVLSKDKEDKFNDITDWDYKALIKAFCQKKDFIFKRAKTIKEFEGAIKKINKEKGKKPIFIELYTDKYDFGNLGDLHVKNMKAYSNSLQSNL